MLLQRIFLYIRLICVFSFLSCLNAPLHAQSPDLNVTDWAKKLTNPAPANNIYVQKLDAQLVDYPAKTKFINELGKKGNSTHFLARFNIVKAYAYFRDAVEKKGRGPEPQVGNDTKKEIIRLLNIAMQEAYLSNDDHLIANISIYYGQISYSIEEYEAAMMYMINGVDLNEKIQTKNNPNDYRILGELLYKTREYKESVKYSIKAINAWQTPAQKIDSIFIMWANNTAALGYHRLLNYDSAFIYYNEAQQLARLLHMDLWQSIIGGNMGQIYYAQKKYDTALVLFLKDYANSNKQGLLDNAANSLQWVARAQLAKGNKLVALQYVREAFPLLTKAPDAFYLLNCYLTATEAFKALGLYDSTFYYNKKYEVLNDSLNKLIALSSIKISKVRAEDEQNRFNVKILQQEKKNQLLERNILITTIILLSIIGFLFFNQQQSKNRIRMEKIRQEMDMAKDQLKLFTNNIKEKTALIEKLEDQLKNKDASAEQQLLMNELSQQTILTEDDWNQFKSLFEKIYPGFFINLKQKAPDITLAEQRMAALTRLQLTTKQMASMLGISVDSVHKTRQRLRQRFNLTTEVNMEEYIANI